MGGGSLYHDPPPPSTLTGVTESPGPPTATPRIVCHACRMRFATLVDPACRLCGGLGVLTLGAAALHHHGPWTTALAVQLFIEAAAREAAATLPYADRPQALDQAITNLQAAGALARPTDRPTAPTGTPRPATTQAQQQTHVTAHQLAFDWGAHPTPADHKALHAEGNTADLARARRTAPHLIPQLSATGNPSHTARAADPIEQDAPNVARTAQAQQAAHRAAARLQPALTEAARS